MPKTAERFDKADSGAPSTWCGLPTPRAEDGLYRAPVGHFCATPVVGHECRSTCAGSWPAWPRGESDRAEDCSWRSGDQGVHREG